MWVEVCTCMFTRSSLHSVRFGQLLRCAHKRIVNIIKVYIERSTMQVEFTTIPKKYIEFIHDYVCKFEESNAISLTETNSRELQLPDSV